MFKLDNNFLSSLGLGSLPVDEKNKLLQAIYERLEMNVGMRLAEKMTDSQLDEFEGFIDRNDEAGALRWLETNFPNYKQVVAEELEKLKTEISQAAPHILAAAQQTGQVQQPTQQPVTSGLNMSQHNPTNGLSQQPASPIDQDTAYQVNNQPSYNDAPEPMHYQQSNPVSPQYPPASPVQNPNQDNGSDNSNSWPDQQPPPGPGI